MTPSPLKRFLRPVPVFAVALTLAIPGAVAMTYAQQRGPGNRPHRQGPGQQDQRPPRDQQGNSDQGPGNRRGPTSRPSPDQLFDRADANHDGVLSREEFAQFINSHRPPPPPPDGNDSGD